MLISKAVDSGLLEVVPVGRNKISISHLQYVDDTIFMCRGKLQFASSIKYLLRNFEIISGLKVNFNKCNIVGINVGHNLVRSMTEILMCEVTKLPLSYLGVVCWGTSQKIRVLGEVGGSNQKKIGEME